VAVGQVGDVIQRKGLADLIAAWPPVAAALPDARLVVVGRSKSSDRYVETCRRQAERLGVTGSLVWAGHHDRIANVLAALDVCALASREESFPVSILEAMAAELPVVATAVGGVAEMVVDGATGRLVPPRRPDRLASALIPVVGDATLRRRLGAAGRERVEQNFSPAAIAPRVEAVLESVIRRSRCA
jgi:glycosyltransferase involved in cell wall biosynthesis